MVISNIEVNYTAASVMVSKIGVLSQQLAGQLHALERANKREEFQQRQAKIAAVSDRLESLHDAMFRGRPGPSNSRRIADKLREIYFSPPSLMFHQVETVLIVSGEVGRMSFRDWRREGRLAVPAWNKLGAGRAVDTASETVRQYHEQRSSRINHMIWMLSLAVLTSIISITLLLVFRRKRRRNRPLLVADPWGLSVAPMLNAIADVPPIRGIALVDPPIRTHRRRHNQPASKAIDSTEIAAAANRKPFVQLSGRGLEGELVDLQAFCQSLLSSNTARRRRSRALRRLKRLHRVLTGSTDYPIEYSKIVRCLLSMMLHDRPARGAASLERIHADAKVRSFRLLRYSEN